jgi:hypothetical protein
LAFGGPNSSGLNLKHKQALIKEMIATDRRSGLSFSRQREMTPTILSKSARAGFWPRRIQSGSGLQVVLLHS